MSPRDPNHCRKCGASSYHARLHRVGMSRSCCPTCGAMRCKWFNDVAIDETLPDGRGLARMYRVAQERPLEPVVPPRKTLMPSERMRAEEGWQRSYDARRAAEKRLGLLPQDDENTSAEWGAVRSRAIASMRRIEDQQDPMDELLAAARAGDEDAMARADELYHWREREQRTG